MLVASPARDVLGSVAAAMISVAGTTFSVTVAALTLASNPDGAAAVAQLHPRPRNQFALGALVATFAYALVALRSVHEAADSAFMPPVAVPWPC